MKKTFRVFIFLMTFYLSVAPSGSFACSMCKVTINGHTYLGSNEDSWRSETRIWFEKGSAEKLGSVYVGYSDLLPQGGMNEAGLAFDGLTTPPKSIKKNTALTKETGSITSFAKAIMQTCRTVEDVKQLALRYNRQKILANGEFLFADKTGHYLVMESDTLILGNDEKYLIANFCPSVISKKQKQSFARYRRGELFLQNHLKDTSSNICFALTDTMHECRERVGDGTMYSSVADLEQGNFTLYFYHDFQHPVSFHLQTELVKGNHILQIPSLFPKNIEYEKFLTYKTPQNNTAILRFVSFCAVLFAFSSLFFLISFFRRKRMDEARGNRNKLLFVFIDALLLWYLFILVQNQGIFYFPSPYQDYQFSMVTIAAYIPFVLILAMFLVLRFSVRIFKNTSWTAMGKIVLVFNNLSYLVLIALFFYWGLYKVW